MNFHWQVRSTRVLLLYLLIDKYQLFGSDPGNRWRGGVGSIDWLGLLTNFIRMTFVFPKRNITALECCVYSKVEYFSSADPGRTRHPRVAIQDQERNKMVICIFKSDIGNLSSKPREHIFIFLVDANLLSVGAFPIVSTEPGDSLSHE